MKKKVIAITVVCMLLAAIFSACASPAPKPAPSSSSTPVKKTTADYTGTVTYWQMNAGVERNAVYEEHVVQFNKKYPNIKVQLSNFPSAESLQKVQLAAVSDDMPDACDLAGMYIPPLILQKAIVPLDDYIAKWDAKDEIMPILLEGTRAYSPDNKIYYIPGNAQLGILWYRSDLFDAPKTWDEFYSTVKKFTNKTDKTYGFTIRGVAGVTNAMSFMYGYSGITEFFKNDKCTINDPLHVEAMEKYYGMYKVYTPESDITNNFKEMTAVFDSGVAMMALHNTGSYVDHLKTLGEGKFAAARIPKPINGNVLVDIDQPPAGFVMGKNKNANYESTFAFISYLSEFEAQNYRSQKIGTVPTNIKVFEQEWTKKMPQYQLVMDALTSKDTKLVAPPIYLADYNKILTDIGDKGFQNVMMGTGTTVKQVLDDMAVAFEKANNEYKEIIKK